MTVKQQAFKVVEDLPEHAAALEALEAGLEGLRTRLVGDRVRGRWREPSSPSILSRVGQVAEGHWGRRQATVSRSSSAADRSKRSGGRP